MERGGHVWWPGILFLQLLNHIHTASCEENPMRVPQEPQARESSMIQVTSACSDYQETLRMPTEIFPCLLLMEWTRLPLGVGGAAQ